MSKLIEVKPEEFSHSAFSLIGKDWMLITAEAENKVNTMTASWGGLGVMWSKNVVFVVIRPQRYTKQFIDSTDNFSLSFFNASFKKQLSYIGSVSGKNENKIENSGLTLIHYEDTPCFAEATATIICKKLYAQDFKPDSFIAKELSEKWYPNADYHTLYIAEVVKILAKE